MIQFIIEKTKDGKFFFVLVSDSNKTFATSIAFDLKKECYDEIEAVIDAIPSAEIIDRTT